MSEDATQLTRRNFIAAVGAMVSSLATSGIPMIPHMSAPLAGLARLYQAREQLFIAHGDPWIGAWRAIAEAAPGQLDRVFAEQARRAYEFQLRTIKHDHLQAFTVNALLKDEQSWETLPGEGRAIVAHAVAQSSGNLVPSADRQRLGAALYHLAMDDATRDFVTEGTALEEYLHSHLRHSIDELLRARDNAPNETGYFYNFKKTMLHFASWTLKRGHMVSEATFKELGFDKEFESYADFTDQVRAQREKEVIREAESQTMRAGRVREALAHPSLLILHHPRDPLRHSDGLRESYHVIECDHPIALDNSPAAAARFAIQNYLMRFDKNDVALAGNGSELHIVDPPQALKILLDEARRQKAPVTGRDLL